ETINYNLIIEMDSSSYIGPLRAVIQRFYRYQNVDVDEILPDGSNIPMFLMELDKDNLKELNKWLLESFGFEILIARSGEDNFELKIKINGAKEHNISDVGFGYSQILPILIMIWRATLTKSTTNGFWGNKMLYKDRIIAIEQPELHLHPRLIYKLAKALGIIVQKESNKNVKFVIETHSKDLLDKIGELIGDGQLNKDKVNIVLFNAHKEGMENEVEFAKYSDDGILDNWPYGFFYENAD
ncbi:MAG: AAA family ATPase, partial [Prevotella sp.]|nr:AAA family ATPase [Prevotella sp.]